MPSNEATATATVEEVERLRTENARLAATLVVAERERDAAREAEAYWRQWGFDADELSTRRLVEEIRQRHASELHAAAIGSAGSRIEAALRLFAACAGTMPREGWVSTWVEAQRDIPLWWFHTAQAALTGGAGDGAKAGEPGA